MTATNPTSTVREAGDEGIAAVIAAHEWVTLDDGLPGCRCGWINARVTGPRPTHRTHVADALAPLIAERVDQAEAEAAYAQQDYDARGERLWRLAAKAGHVPHESDNDATAELVVSQALDNAAERERAAGERALREAASDLVADCTNQSGPCICAARHWLRDRADQIGGE